MSNTYLFKDREDAGKILARILQKKNYQNPFILGLPRGGVILAASAASALHAPFDVVISRKIGAPGHQEYGIGAISEDEIPYFSPENLPRVEVQAQAVKTIVEDETNELRRRVKLYRHGHHLSSLSEHTVIVVDDGLATGVTAIAAGKYLRKLQPLKLVLAIPVAPDMYSPEIKKIYDEVVCPHFIENMSSVGLWYREFSQVDDREVVAALKLSDAG